LCVKYGITKGKINYYTELHTVKNKTKILNMKIVYNKISIEELKSMAENTFGSLVKAVVDVEREIIVVDGELHSDEESYLLENGSKQSILWGINIYPDKVSKDWIEFDSLINIKPWMNNRGRGIDDPSLKEKIKEIVEKRVKR